MPDTVEGRSALPDNRILRDFEYDLYDRLVKAEVRRRNPVTGEWDKEIWYYEYDALDRRVAKWRETEVSGSLQL